MLPKIGYKVDQLAEVGSTNTYILDRLASNVFTHGMAVIAYNQTGGRGQHGRVWQSVAGKNITMSIVWDTTTIPLNLSFMLTVIVSLSLHELLNEYCPNKVSIKWPNDLYIDDKKIGGILIERKISSHQPSLAVVGIGVNINQIEFSEPIRSKATSLAIMLNKAVDKITIIDDLFNILEAKWCLWLNENNAIQLLLDQYNEHLYQRNKTVLYYDYVTKETTEYQLEGVTIDGGLKLFNQSQGVLLVKKLGEGSLQDMFSHGTGS